MTPGSGVAPADKRTHGNIDSLACTKWFHQNLELTLWSEDLLRLATKNRLALELDDLSSMTTGLSLELDDFFTR